MFVLHSFLLGGSWFYWGGGFRNFGRWTVDLELAEQFKTYADAAGIAEGYEMAGCEVQLASLTD